MAFVSIKPLDKINIESDPKILVYTCKRDDEDIAKALVKKRWCLQRQTIQRGFYQLNTLSYFR